jgi:hypothetical protein
LSLCPSSSPVGLSTASFCFVSWSTCRPLCNVSSSRVVPQSCVQPQDCLSHSALSLRRAVRLYFMYYVPCPTWVIGVYTYITSLYIYRSLMYSIMRDSIYNLLLNNNKSGKKNYVSKENIIRK